MIKRSPFFRPSVGRLKLGRNISSSFSDVAASDAAKESEPQTMYVNSSFLIFGNIHVFTLTDRMKSATLESLAV